MYKHKEKLSYKADSMNVFSHCRYFPALSLYEVYEVRKIKT